MAEKRNGQVFFGLYMKPELLTKAKKVAEHKDTSVAHVLRDSIKTKYANLPKEAQ